MKKIILEISFLVQGFFPVKNYEIHNFKLQTEKLNEELINPIFKENLFHVPFHLILINMEEICQLITKKPDKLN